MKMKHWQDPINALLGVWLIVSPWIFGFSTNTPVMGNFVIVGIALVAAALGAIYVPKAWEEWVEGALGLWMVVSPWILKYTAVHAARLDAIAAGVLILVFGLWAAAEEMGWQEGAGAIKH